MVINQQEISICLCHPQDQRNIASCIRVLANYGIKTLKVITHQELDREALDALSSYALSHIDLQKYTCIEDAVQQADFIIGTSRRERQNRLISQWELPNLLPQLEHYSISNLHILFGNERTGLLKNELNVCQTLLSIPTNPLYPSMNLSHAVTCVLYEYCRHTHPTASVDQHNQAQVLVPFQVKQAFLQQLTKAAHCLSYPTIQKAEAYALYVSKVLEKGNLTQQEYSALIGMFKEISRQIET